MMHLTDLIDDAAIIEPDICMAKRVGNGMHADD